MKDKNQNIFCESVLNADAKKSECKFTMEVSTSMVPVAILTNNYNWHVKLFSSGVAPFVAASWEDLFNPQDHVFYPIPGI